jgi:hypothetical protein
MHTQSHGPTPSEFPGFGATRRSASAGPFPQILSHIPSMPTGSLSLQTTEDGEKNNAESGNGAAGINFAVQLKQFEHMQQQHRLHRVVKNPKPPRRPPVVPNQVLISPSSIVFSPTGSYLVRLSCYIIPKVEKKLKIKNIKKFPVQCAGHVDVGLVCDMAEWSKTRSSARWTNTKRGCS